MPSDHRIKDRRDFLRVQRYGKRVHTAHFVIRHLSQPSELLTGSPQKLGITVSKKVGNAPTRNRIKRWVRETFRQNKERFPKRFVVVIAKHHASEIRDARAAKEELLRAFPRRKP